MNLENENYKIEFCVTDRGDSVVDDLLDTLPATHRIKIQKWFKYLEKEGPNLPRPYADSVAGKIRELRVSIAHHQYRFLYFFHGKCVVVTHGFLKKAWKIPFNEIKRANHYREDWLERYGKEER